MLRSIQKEKHEIKLPQNFYEVLTANSRSMLFVKDREFRIVYANPSFLELYAPEQRDSIIGSVSAQGFSEDDAKVFLAEDLKAFETGFSEIVEEITDYSGRKRIFQTQKTRLIDETTGDAYVLGIANDITRLVEREQQLAKSNISLENFAAMAAHDLRSPLSSVYSSIEYISHDKNTILSVNATNHVRMMIGCLEGLIEQVSHLLEACKATDTIDESALIECDLSTMFEEVRFNLKPQIEESRAKILSVELPRIRVNKPLFRQLISNLVENSLKYRSDTTPIIILRYERRDRNHCFSVEDNGLGISPEDSEKIFGMGAQVNNKAQGYGVGLSLCRNIVESHGGKIWVDPDFKPGAKICFTLPVGH